MQVVREFVTSYLSKHPVLYTFSDSVGLISEILYCIGTLQDKKLRIDQLFDQLQKNGRWNQYSFGAIAFYGESCMNMGRVAFLMDKHLVLTTDANSKIGLHVTIKPIHWRSDLVAVIKPNYAHLGCLV